MKIRQIYENSVKKLQDDDEKYILTEMAIAHVLKKDRLYVKMNMDDEVGQKQQEEINNVVASLSLGKPIHYITGKRDFMGFDFCVSGDVLIPRSDTEILVQEALQSIKSGKIIKKTGNSVEKMSEIGEKTDRISKTAVKNSKRNNKIRGLEIGSGSGIISISLLKNLPYLTMTAVDLSDSAVELTAKNAVELSVYDRIDVIKSDIYEKIDGLYDFIISNPPYIRTDDIQRLDRKIREHEPVMALDGKKDGLYFYKKIIEGAKDYLSKNGMVFFEIGFDQAKDVSEILQKNGFSDIKITKDLSGLERAVTAFFSK